MTIAEIRGRVSSLCAGDPFGFTRAQTPFSFDLQPTGAIDEVFRIEAEGNEVVGGFNYLEERTDLLQIWVARKHASDPEGTYQRLLVDVTSIRSAVIHDAAEQSGEYFVPDGGAAVTVSRERQREFAVVRLTLPVNYELFV